MKYQPPFEPSHVTPVGGVHNPDPDAGYQNGNPSTGQRGSIVPCEAIEHTMREVMKVITEAGIEPDHEDLTQLWQALQWLVGERLVESDGNGDVAVYAGVGPDGAHHIRSLEEGANISLTLVESPPDSGEYRIRIAATGGGGGGGGDPLVNIGDGAGEVYAGNFGSQERIRTLKGVGGIVTDTDDDVVLIDGSGLTKPSLASIAPMLMIEEQRAGGVAPAAFATMNVWQKRGLNAVIANQIEGASLADNQITLPAGTYRADYGANAFDNGSHRCRLRNVTANATVGNALGADSYTNASATCNSSAGRTRFTLAVESVLELQHAAFTANLGKVGDSSNIAPETHIDAMISIIKEA